MATEPALPDGSANHQHMAEVSLIRCERPRADEGRDLASRNQIELQRRNDGFVRRADRSNECRPVGQSSENVRRTRRGKCHHSVGTRHCAGLFAHHIGIGAGRNIDRNHVRRARVQQPDCLGVESRHRRLETRPQNRVEQQLRIRIRPAPVPALAPRRSRNHGRDRKSCEHLGCIAPQFGRLSQQYDSHFSASRFQFSRRHKAVSAIVALAADHANALRGRILEQQQTPRRPNPRSPSA